MDQVMFGKGMTIGESSRFEHLPIDLAAPRLEQKLSMGDPG
jgi:hypothetical protein